MQRLIEKLNIYFVSVRTVLLANKESANKMAYIFFFLNCKTVNYFLMPEAICRRNFTEIWSSRGKTYYSLKKKKIEWIIHPIYAWSEEISCVKEWILHDCNSSRVKLHYSTSEISSGRFIPKEVITDVTTQGVKIYWIEWFFFREYVA